MTPSASQIEASQTAQKTEEIWRSIRDSGDIQYAPVNPPAPPETPAWLKQFYEWLHDVLMPLGKALNISWPTLKIVLIVLAVLLAMLLLWSLLGPWVRRLLAKKSSDTDAGWMPDRDEASALLANAERLAANGQYEEAVHLLLQRSIEHIRDARPDWLFPASTAREIAQFPLLPQSARAAFAIIATRVERSLFALRKLDESDWRAARDAYANFALAKFSQ